VFINRDHAREGDGKASHCRYKIGDVADDAVAKASSAP
jgi:hypothetical protein